MVAPPRLAGDVRNTERMAQFATWRGRRNLLRLQPERRGISLH